MSKYLIKYTKALGLPFPHVDVHTEDLHVAEDTMRELLERMCAQFPKQQIVSELFDLDGEAGPKLVLKMVGWGTSGITVYRGSMVNTQIVPVSQ